MGLIFGGLAAIVLAALVLLFVHSPGRLPPFRDKSGNVLEGSIAEKVFMEIGGVRQGMFITGKSTDNPVLLFLHGGPGSPGFCLTSKFPVNLADEFTVCWWEQRGSAMSYSKGIPDESMTVRQLVSDTAEVTNYLRGRFGQDRIYILGHSWGSFLGMHVIQRHPELYEAYIGMGQISDQYESEKLLYDFALAQARKHGNRGIERKLLKYNLSAVENVTSEYIMGVRGEAMAKYGVGIIHRKYSMIWDMSMSVMRFKGYTLKEKCNYVVGNAYSYKRLFKDVLYSVLSDDVPRVGIPVHVVHGRYDMQVNHDLAKAYIERLDAPEKGFYTLEDSAHSPMLEEPKRFMQLMREVVLKNSSPALS